MITDPVAVFVVLAAVVWVSLWLEERFAQFRAFGAALVGILLAMALSNAGLLPAASPTYDFLMGPGVSVGIALILLSVDVRSVLRAGPTMLAAFVIGAAGTALGAIIAGLTLAGAVGPETWKLAGQYTGTYTGGGVNFAALAQAFDTSSDLFTAAVAADIIVTALWMAVCLGAPVVWDRAQRRRAATDGSGSPGVMPPGGPRPPADAKNITRGSAASDGDADDRADYDLHRDDLDVAPIADAAAVSDSSALAGGAAASAEEVAEDGRLPDGARRPDPLEKALYSTLREVTLKEAASLALLAIGSVWLAERIGELLPQVPAVLWLTTIVLAAAQVPAIQRLSGSAMWGNYLLNLFLASNGAQSVIANIFAVGPAVFWFAAVTVAVHGVIIFGVGRLFRLDLPTLSVASQANVGGPASAMALAGARGYADRILPGVAVGLLGYALGNYSGFVIGTLVRGVLGA